MPFSLQSTGPSVALSSQVKGTFVFLVKLFVVNLWAGRTYETERLRGVPLGLLDELER
jgi:hypothetical protein